MIPVSRSWFRVSGFGFSVSDSAVCGSRRQAAGATAFDQTPTTGNRKLEIGKPT
jgi:hypothetical protein